MSACIHMHELRQKKCSDLNSQDGNSVVADGADDTLGCKDTEGNTDGIELGLDDGWLLGCELGLSDGIELGLDDGWLLGCALGLPLG